MSDIEQSHDEGALVAMAAGPRERRDMRDQRHSYL